jgi:hypothetical protein
MLAYREHRIKLLRQTGRLGGNLRTVGSVHAHEGVDNALGMWEFHAKRNTGIRRVSARLLPSLILYLHRWVRVTWLLALHPHDARRGRPT